MAFKKSQITIIGCIFVVSAINRLSSAIAIDSINLASEKEGSRSLYAADTIYNDCGSMLFSSFTGVEGNTGNDAYCASKNLSAMCPVSEDDIKNIQACANIQGHNNIYWTANVGGFMGPDGLSLFGCPSGFPNEGETVVASLVDTYAVDCDPDVQYCGLVLNTLDPDFKMTPTFVNTGGYATMCYKKT